MSLLLLRFIVSTSASDCRMCSLCQMRQGLQQTLLFQEMHHGSICYARLCVAHDLLEVVATSVLHLAALQMTASCPVKCRLKDNAAGT